MRLSYYRKSTFAPWPPEQVFRWRCLRLPLAFLFDHLDPHPHHLLHQSARQRSVHGKLNGPLRQRIALQLLPECLDHRACREEAAMLRKPRIPHQHFLPPHCRNPVADDLGRPCGRRRPYRRAHLRERPSPRLRDPCQVPVHTSRRSLALRPPNALPPRLFHVSFPLAIPNCSSFQAKPEISPLHPTPFCATPLFVPSVCEG